MLKDFSYGIIPLKAENKNWFVFIIQHHAGHWSFPKGHKESNEDDFEAAKRELKEETNLNIKKIISEDPVQEFYYFYENGNRIEKTVSYYLAETSGNVKLQHEEIMDGKWVSLDDAEEILTFTEAKRILKQVKKYLIY